MNNYVLKIITKFSNHLFQTHQIKLIKFYLYRGAVRKKANFGVTGEEKQKMRLRR